MRKIFVSAILAATWANAAHAIPTLQLGITDGIYDATPGVETVVATTNPFTLSAYLLPDNQGTNTISDTYYLSFAVVPKVGPIGSNLGSFTIDVDGAGGALPITINVTADMVYGTPPIDTVWTQSSDPGDLADHGIFDTYFGELAFQFDSAVQSDAFDTQLNPGEDASDNPGSGMYFHDFLIDVTNLNSAYAIHFDLYNSEICTNTQSQCNIVGDVDQTQFAPFSHDAQSGPGGDDGGDDSEEIPEPGTLALLGLGLAGLAAARRRRA